MTDRKSIIGLGGDMTPRYASIVILTHMTNYRWRWVTPNIVMKFPFLMRIGETYLPKSISERAI